MASARDVSGGALLTPAFFVALSSTFAVAFAFTCCLTVAFARSFTLGFGCCVRLGFRAFACALSATQHVAGRAYVRASGCVVVAMGCGVDAAERVAVWRNVAGRA